MLTTFRSGLFSAALGICLALSCSKKAEPATSIAQAAKVSGVNQLPNLRLTDDTQGLMLTWVDESGDFRVVEKISDVPAVSRGQVRVVISGQDFGTAEAVYVADLSRKGADGSYSVATKTRNQWDEIGAVKRKARLEQLAPGTPAAEHAAAVVAEGPVIVYGASWCKPCHDAENYLRSKGVQVVKKDIEEDAEANREMRDKLQRSHLPNASIPIIDVGGKLLVGFSAAALDQALLASGKLKTL